MTPPPSGRIWPEKRLLLFDLDGVLLDSADNMRVAWAAVRERFALDTSFEAYFAEIGRPFQDILDRLGIQSNREAIERAYLSASIEHIGETPFFPGVPETLASLAARGMKLGIVTSKDGVRTAALLARLPVAFATVQTPRPGLRGKPAPDSLLAALVEAAVDPAEAVYIGDMDADHEAARRAGVDYLHAGWGFGKPPVGAETLHDLADLARRLG